MRTRQLIVFLAVLSFAPPVAIGATKDQTVEKATVEIAKTSPRASTIPGTTELYQVLREERKVLERQADRHVEGMKDLYDRALYLFASLLVGGLALFWYLFGRTKDEMLTEVRMQIKKGVDALVEQEVSKLRHSQQMLKEEVDDLTAYRFRKVIWVAPRDEDKRIDPFISVLRAFGVSHVERITGEMQNIVQERSPDLVILSFDSTERTRSLLRRLIHELKAANPPVPVLIFTYSFGCQEVRLGKEDWEILKGFDWYLPTNVPATLIAQSVALLKRGRDKYASTSE